MHLFWENWWHLSESWVPGFLGVKGEGGGFFVQIWVQKISHMGRQDFGRAQWSQQDLAFFARGGDLIYLCTHDQLRTKKLAYQQLKKGGLLGSIQNVFLPIFMQLSQHFCDICLAALRNILCQLRNKNCRITVTVYTSCPHHTLLYCCGNLLWSFNAALGALKQGNVRISSINLQFIV